VEGVEKLVGLVGIDVDGSDIDGVVSVLSEALGGALGAED